VALSPASTAPRHQGIDLIEKDDARRRLAGLLEDLANAFL